MSRCTKLGAFQAFVLGRYLEEVLRLQMVAGDTTVGFISLWKIQVEPI